MVNRLIRLLLTSMLISLALTSGGCGTKTPNYTPSLEIAEDAVRRGLDKWKMGEPPGELPGTRPLVHVTDGGRKLGQTLESYQILGEVHGVCGRTIAVTLQLDNPAEELKARYIALGIDPLLVFRQEDFDLLMHWDHHMPAPQAQEIDVSAGPHTTRDSASDPIESQLPVRPESSEASK
jgi:hypothetical protein